MAVLVNVLAVVPLVAAQRFPFLAAAAHDVLRDVVLLAAPEAPITRDGVSACRSTRSATSSSGADFLLAVPLLLPFLFHADGAIRRR